MTTEPGGGDALRSRLETMAYPWLERTGEAAELRERLARRAFKLWVGPSRLFDAADPSVRAACERDADEILAEIAASGHVLVKADALLWLQQSNYYGSRWAAEHPLPAEGER